MSLYLEIDDFENYERAADSRSFFIVENPERQLVDTLSKLKSGYSDIMPFHSLELHKTVGSVDRPGYLKASLSGGFRLEEPQVWRWMLTTQGGEGTHMLLGTVSWGDFNARRIARHDQGRLFRESYKFEQEATGTKVASRAIRASGISVVWQQLKTDHQGGVHRVGFVDDEHGFLAGLVEHVIDESDIPEKADKIRNVRAKLASDLENNPPSYYQRLDKPPTHPASIGFIGLGIKSEQHILPSRILNRHQKTEQVLSVLDLPSDIKELLADPGQNYIAKTNLPKPRKAAKFGEQ